MMRVSASNSDRRLSGTKTSWSTDTVDRRERFSYWREFVCQSLFNVSAEAPPGDFTAQMKVRASGQHRFWTAGSSAYSFVRTARNIAHAPADHFTILLQVRGETAISHDDDRFVLRPNEVGAFNGRQPFTASNSDGARRVVAVLPLPLVMSRVPWLRARPLYRLESNSRFLDLTRLHMVRLISDDLNETQSNLLAENLCNLISLATTDVEPNRLPAELRLDALRAYCRQNLHNPRLSPSLVAERFCMSVRTLHLRFGKLGQTFGSWLLETRLDTCAKGLIDPHQHGSSISEIAYDCGFNDLSYFNKTFRDRYGMSPGHYRWTKSMDAIQRSKASEAEKAEADRAANPFTPTTR
jgi:AraC family transcriptional regulator, positive regulator of tynA and feaB